MQVDEKNAIVGFQGRMVHVLNKNEHSTVGTPFHSLVAARKSVILLGDHIVRGSYLFRLSRSLK